MRIPTKVYYRDFNRMMLHISTHFDISSVAFDHLYLSLICYPIYWLYPYNSFSSITRNAIKLQKTFKLLLYGNTWMLLFWGTLNYSRLTKKVRSKETNPQWY